MRADRRFLAPVVCGLIALGVSLPLAVGADAQDAAPRATAVGKEASDLLARAAEYLADYEKSFSVVVSEEKYQQNTFRSVGAVSQRRERTLRSDVIVTSVGDNDWVAFRDVFEVDSKPVRDRDARLQKLFVETPSQALAQARRILDESARYNLGSLQRNINVPTMALTYLRRSNQARSDFTPSGREKVENVQTVILSFRERAKPTIIRSRTDDLPAIGRFWVEPASGRVVKSEIQVDGKISRSKITVTYAPAPKLTIWAPVAMKEEYTTTSRETIKCDAKYSNFRQFKVVVSEIVK